MNCLHRFSSETGQIAILVDPDKTSGREYLAQLTEKARFAHIDFFFVGGSTVSREDLQTVVQTLKELSNIPVVIFPGASHQISPDADALLFLNLISGRNPDYLIGHHVACAEEVLESGIEVIPTSYLLIDGGKLTSVAYVSQTTPIPSTNMKIVRQTAIAGHLLGHKITYLDAGSGASQSVPEEMVNDLKSRLPESPIVVGGGIRSLEQLNSLAGAGTNVLVIGNYLEENMDFLLDVRQFKLDRKTSAPNPSL